MPSVAGSNIHFSRRRRQLSVPNAWPAVLLWLPLVPTKGQEKGNVGDSGHNHRAGETWAGASIQGARISVMAATVLGHRSGVESFVGGLLSARLTEVLSGGRSSCNVFQSVSRSTRSY